MYDLGEAIFITLFSPTMFPTVVPNKKSIVFSLYYAIILFIYLSVYLFIYISLISFNYPTNKWFILK